MAEFDSSVTAYFGGDTSGLKNAVGDAGNTLDKLSNKVADKVLGMRDMSHAIATALGLNIEKIAEKVARFVTGMSKETEEAFKEMAKLSQETADINIAAGFKRLNAEQQVQMLENQRNALQEKFSRTQAEILERQKQMREAADASNISLFEASRLMEKSKMTAEESRALAKMANELAKNGVALQEAQGNLEKKRADDRKKADAEEEKANKERLKDIEDTNKYWEQYHARREKATDAYQKMLFEQKSTEEQLLDLGKQKEELEREMRSLEKDSTRYMEAAVQLNALNLQITSRQKTEERGITDEKKAQLDLLNREQSIRSAISADVNSQFALSDKPEDIQRASTEALGARLRQLEAGLKQLQDPGYALNAATLASGGYGTALQSVPFTTSINRIREELALRSNVLSSGSKSRALDSYGGNPLFFDQVYSRATLGTTSEDEIKLELQKINRLIASAFGR